MLDVLRPAPDAVPQLCPHQSVCGGCPLQIMPYPAQLHWKKNLALEALIRIGRLDRSLLSTVWEAPRPGGGSCVSPVQAARRAGRRRAMGKHLLQRFPDLAAFIHEDRQSPDALATGERRVLCLNEQGREEAEAALLHLPLGSRLFSLDAASFFQVNTGAAQSLARLATEMLNAGGAEKGSSLLDLYRGVGAPGQLPAPAFERLLGLEYDRRAVALARRNAEQAGLTHCRYEAGDAAALLERLRHDRATVWDTALADPPRAGLAPRVLGSLLKLRPRRILYRSCNPTTLARNAQALQTHYEPARDGRGSFSAYSAPGMPQSLAASGLNAQRTYAQMPNVSAQSR